MLFDTAVDLRDIEQATSYLEKLPADSAARADAELRLGQMYWSQYLRQGMLEEGERPSQDVLDELVKKAQDTLRQGIDRMSKAVEAGEEPSYPLAFSVLALAQILIDAGNADEAVRWLDDPKVGPMSLIAANAPCVAGRTDFQIDTYKAALRAYVGAEKLDRAEAVMNQLEQVVGQEDAAGATRLTQIYISLGRQLEELLKRLRSEGKNDEILKVSQGFEKFLDTISRREQGNSFSSLNWVAQTFSSLAAGLDPGDGPLPEAALKYYESAGATYLRLLKAPPADMKAGADTAIKVQLAVCLRALGRKDQADRKQAQKNFEQALGMLVGILKQRETRVDVQMEAARTYQEMARATEQPQFYLNAILGGQKQANGSYLVWGWNGISRRVASREEFRPIFFEARYNIALCRVRLAQTQKGDEQSKTLEQAENDIVITHKLYPSLGGEEWFEKFDTLLKAIRKFQGDVNPQGLAVNE
jgi:tetratricopeptide (TPR) repeat protein